MAVSGGGDRVRFGARLRHTREASRLSLGDVAARSGLTKSFLSRVERDMTSPSVASVTGICDALGLSVAELFQTPRMTLVPRAERPRIADLPQADVVDTLITPADERHVTVLETAAAPGGTGGATLYTLPSECEVCFVLQGAAEVQAEDQQFTLEAGDALIFRAATPHSWKPLTRACASCGSWLPAFLIRNGASDERCEEESRMPSSPGRTSARSATGGDHPQQTYRPVAEALAESCKDRSGHNCVVEAAAPSGVKQTRGRTVGDGCFPHPPRQRLASAIPTNEALTGWRTGLAIARPTNALSPSSSEARFLPRGQRCGRRFSGRALSEESMRPRTSSRPNRWLSLGSRGR